MNLQIPLKKIFKNMILTKNGHVWAYYKVKPFSINSNNDDEVVKHKEILSHITKQLEKHGNIHFMTYPRSMNLEERFEAIEKDFADSIKHIGRRYCERTIESLGKSIGDVTEETFIIGISLKDSFINETVRDSLDRAIESVTDGIMKIVGYEVKETGKFFDKYMDIEREVYATVHSLGGSPLTEDETFYINRNPFVRGIDHSVEEEKKKRVEFSLSDSIIDPTNPGFIRLLNQNGEGWSAFVVIVDTPFDLLRNHLFEVATNLPFACEFHLKAKFQDLEKVKKKTGNTKKRVKITEKETVQTGDRRKDSTIRNRQALNILENNLDNKVPFIDWLACFVISGGDKDEVSRKAKSLIRILSKRKVKAVKPTADQLQLFYKCLPAFELPNDKNWVQKTHPDGLAETLFGTTNRVGNNVGFYIGRVDNTKKAENTKMAIASSRKPIFYHPFIVNKGLKGSMTDSPHVLISGETGKGKTFLMTEIFYYTTLLKGKKLFFDPKREKKKWFNEAVKNRKVQQLFPEFVEHVNRFRYVTLDADNPENKGVIDPICFLKGKSAISVAVGMIEEIYPLTDKDNIRLAVLDIAEQLVDRRSRGEKVGLAHLPRMMMDIDDLEVVEAGRLLEKLVGNSVLDLAFSEGEREGLSLSAETTILEVLNLKLPDKDKPAKAYSSTDKESIALMYALGVFFEKFGSENPAEETALFIDEGWIFEKSAIGKSILQAIRRVGRSQNNMLVLATQSVQDANGEDDHGNFGTLFAFDEPQERHEILRTLNMEDSEKNRELLAGMIQGQCLYKDNYGRVAKIVVHCPFDELTLALKTVERTASANAEEMFGT